MAKKYSLHYLSADFFNKYNSAQYPEIEQKASRPYIILLVKIEDNTFALPLRTNVRHPNCYKFKNSNRDTASVTGIDYTKAVIVNDAVYLGAEATIDDKEYIELNDRYFFIIKQFENYLKGYCNYVRGASNTYAEKKYRFTTLKYFHKELGLE